MMDRKLKTLDLRSVRLTDGLLYQIQDRNRRVTAPIVLEKCIETGRVDALKHQWDGKAETRPHPFWDSDLGKTIESIAYALAHSNNPELEAQVDEIVGMMEDAQEQDGYFNTYYQTCEPKENRWTNLYYMHELYCMGHLIEGAVAYYQATGKDRFLRLMCRYADLACTLFQDGSELENAYGGHPEIELALVRLYEATQEDRYLALSRRFIGKRGQKPYYFELESLKRGVDTTKTANQKRHLKDYLHSKGPYAEYQAHIPIVEQHEPVGHAVRAMYLLAGASDIADYDHNEALRAATERIWQTMCATQYSIVGGIGPSSDGERFTYAYDIPNEYTYNETCASVALMMAGRRLLERKADGKIADIMEQTLYNTVLSSVSADGERFFYANYLAVEPQRFEHASKAMIDKMRAERQPWFDVACCPPNASRLMGSLHQYVASSGEQALYVHLFGSCDIHTDDMDIQVTTDYPWNGDVHIQVKRVVNCCKLYVRVPGWCRDWQGTHNGAPCAKTLQSGYLCVSDCRENDEISLKLTMEVVAMQANPKVREDCSKIALMRGPVVYCIEQADNGENLFDIAIPIHPDAVLKTDVLPFAKEAVCLTMSGLRYHAQQLWKDALYQEASTQAQPVTVTAIPYYLWGNRGFGEMCVWLNQAL